MSLYGTYLIEYYAVNYEPIAVAKMKVMAWACQIIIE